MVSKRLRTIASTTLAIGVLFISASVAIAQSQARSTSSSLASTAANYSGSAAASGQKVKVKGVVTGVMLTRLRSRIPAEPKWLSV